MSIAPDVLESESQRFLPNVYLSIHVYNQQEYGPWLEKTESFVAGELPTGRPRSSENFTSTLDDNSGWQCDLGVASSKGHHVGLGSEGTHSIDRKQIGYKLRGEELEIPRGPMNSRARRYSVQFTSTYFNKFATMKVLKEYTKEPKTFCIEDIQSAVITRRAHENA